MRIVTGGGLELVLDGTLLTLTHSGRDGRSEQSRLDLARPELLDFEYMQHLTLLLAAFFPGDVPVRAMHAGAGACALPLAWASRRPGSSQVAVDLDGELVEALRDWRVIRPGRGLRLRAGDARVALEGSGATFDVVVRDAFAGDVTPQALSTVEWAGLVRSRLRSPGVYLANVAHGPGRSGKADVAAALDQFPSALAIADRKVWKGVRRGNVTLAAWEDGAPDVGQLGRDVRRLPLPTGIFTKQEILQWLGGARPVTDGAG